MAGAAYVRTGYAGIYQRGEKYVATWTDGDGRTRKRTADTLDEARAIKADAENAKRRGGEEVYVLAQKLLLHDWLDQWAASYRGSTSEAIRANTLADYRADLKWPREHFGSSVRLNRVSRHKVEEFVAWLAAQPGRNGKPVAASTTKRRFAPFRIAMTAAYERGLLARNPCDKVVIPRPREIADKGPKVLTRGQVLALLQATPQQWRPLVRFAAETGCRISEIVALQFMDLDLDGARPTVRIRRAYVRQTMGPPKSRHGERMIRLSPGMADELRAMRERALARAVRVGPIDDELVFATGKGTLLDQRNLRTRVLDPARKQAGLPPIGWHTLRHTCGSLLLEDGVSIKAIQKHLGHHAASFTLDVYLHVVPGDDGPVLDMGEARGKPTASQAAGPDLKVVGG